MDINRISRSASAVAINTTSPICTPDANAQAQLIQFRNLTLARGAWRRIEGASLRIHAK
jgi:hypothetical protein